ncbi:MAG: amidophosphoribosyltransferase [Firmicutes bacterium]|nr:amidophosphoribosyltransferase [Candidatus Fermentithermobacillaceae bacterium]
MGALSENEISEKCGVFAVVGHPNASLVCYYGLYALQHRGQESAGIAVSDGSRIHTEKGTGLVSEVFAKEDILGMVGSTALGHVRYSTAGEGGIEDSQPITVKMWQGQMSFAHNGNLVNARKLRAELERDGSIFQTTSDCEVIPHLMARSKETNPFKALTGILPHIKGAYSLCILTPNGVIAAKDPNGFRPLCLGFLDGAYIVCSETCALDAVGAEFIRELDPGEAIFIDSSTLRVESYRRDLSEIKPSLCAFEFIYFARPDSDIYGLNVHAARKALGRKLAEKDVCSADLVTGIPDSSISAATGYAEQAKIPYEIGLVKNRYIGRTFITPGQSVREIGVKIKLNPLKRVICGKRVVMVDDSIVRGTTSKYIVNLFRAAGATEVHVRISSPPYRFPCYYGIDTSSKGELIAANRKEEEIRVAIGADTLRFLELQDLEDVLGAKVGNLCTACFTGQYPVFVEDMARPGRIE